jgi:hypothetical protein
MDSPMFQEFRTDRQALGAAPVVLTHARGLGLKAIDGTLLYAPGSHGISFDELAEVSIAPLRRHRRSAITQLAACHAPERT